KVAEVHATFDFALDDIAIDFIAQILVRRPHPISFYCGSHLQWESPCDPSGRSRPVPDPRPASGFPGIGVADFAKGRGSVFPLRSDADCQGTVSGFTVAGARASSTR